jgi:DNA polymerase-3 subunit delta
MLIFLHGVDTFRSRQQLKKMMTKFKADRDPQGLNVAVLDCAKEDAGKILEQILAVPFLAEKRMVVLENLLTATGKGDLQEQILKRIEDKKLDENNVYIFWEADAKPKTNAGKKLWEILGKEKYAQEFPELTPAKLSAWIEAEIKNRDGKIESAALSYLTENVGADMWRLNSLINQLLSYKTQQPVTLVDAQLFLDEKVDDNIFNLIDAIVAGQKKLAYQMIREQYKKGEDAMYILAMILRQFRILIELRDLFDREDNLGSDALAKKLGLHPFVVKKSLPFIKRYTLTELKNIYQQLLEIDTKTKTGLGSPDLLLDILVGSLRN